MNDKHHKCPDTTDAAKVVIGFLGVFALAALAGTIWLVGQKAEAALIALVSGLCGTALGGLMSVLSQTKSSAQPPAGTRTDPIAIEGSAESQPVVVKPEG